MLEGVCVIDESNYPLLMFYGEEMIIALILIIIFIILTFFFLYRHHRSTIIKQRGNAIPAEFVLATFARLFVLDARFLLLLGPFGDDAADNWCIIYKVSGLNIEYLNHFFNAMHSHPLTDDI
jgi:hypothetical protein